MTWANVNAKLSFTDMSAADETTVRALMENAYDNSATAKAMFDAWIATEGHTINVKHVANAFQAYRNTGRIEVDLSWLTDNTYIDNNGNAVDDTATTAVLHELVHALTGKADNYTANDYRGDTVVHSNLIYSELGLPEQNSYISYDDDGSLLTRGFAYTNGAAIDRSVAGDRNWNTAAGGAKNDLLIGGASANTLEAGEGNDFLFGGGGNDTLNGGVGGSDTAVLTGKPVDYDLRLNADGTWTAKHVRGTANEGTDTLQNLEKVMFQGGQTFNLAKGGLTYQTDFAFVVDQTGSMWDDIGAVKSSANAIINALFASGTIDARIGVVGFRDNTIGEATSVVLGFTDHDSFDDRKTAALAAINSLGASGGGDTPETAFDGLLKALNGDMGAWRLGAGTKRVALFTDAPAKDFALLPTVALYAANIGATLAGRTTTALGTFGQVDTFMLYMGDAAGRDPGTDGLPLPGYTPSGDPIQPPGSVATVQITTIWIGTGATDSYLSDLSTGSGGSVLPAANASEVVDRLLEVITTANYVVTVDTPALPEGDAGQSAVTFQITRDRADNAATVTLEATGTADGTDVTGMQTTVDFGIGETSKTVTVNVLGDTDVEPDETFGVKIVNVTETATFAGVPTAFTIQTDDPMLGTRRADTLKGTGARDLIHGLGSADRLFGRGGDDEIKGGSGRDRLFGNAGDDTILGHGGNDLLIGGTGDDTLTGNRGADTFRFADGDGDDVIADFDPLGRVHDVIDLRGFDAIASWRDLARNHMAQVGADLVIDTLAGDSVTLLGTDLADLGRSDFLV